VVVLLCRINFLPGLQDVLLGSSHISVSFTHCDPWLLGKSYYTKGDENEHGLPEHSLPPEECGFEPLLEST
jgi:hypothetical protein